MTRSPLVSIIVRCRRPGGLRAAVQSAAAQSHRPLELIVVDLAGHPESAWADLESSPQCVLRHVANAQQLGHAQASNAALAMVRGSYFGFLDDAGVYEPQHVAALVAAALRHPAALVVYVRARVFDAHKRQVNVIGRPLHRALFFHDQLFCLPAALIDTRVLDLGCRFDEALASGSDHDFLEQIAQRGEFVFEPDLAPSYACSSFDETDDARGATIAQRVYFDNMRFAKWTGERLYHSLRAGVLSRRAARIAAAGEGDRARAAFAAALAQYPGDPDALHGLAGCDAQGGQWDRAWGHIREALAFDPANATYRATADRIRQQLRRRGIIVAEGAASGEAGGWGPRWSGEAMPPPSVTAAAPAHRNAPCACGSGRRYKHCCGATAGTRDAAAPTELAPDAALVHRAQRLLHDGESEQAAALLAQLRPPLILDAEVAREAGEACLSMQLLQPALALLERAVTVSGGAPAAVAACDECCHRMFRAAAWQSAGATLRALLERLNARAAGAAPRAPVKIHLVCKLDTLGGTETRALNLYHCLAPHAQVTLWSTVPPLAAHAVAVPVRPISPADVPAGGVLVLVGTYFSCAPWLEQQSFDRVVICHNLAEQYSSLMERLIELEENAAAAPVELTFPSHLFRELAGLPGRVEYSAVDVAAFRRRRTARAHAGALVIGRHSRAYAAKFHPNDPAFLRTLIARGHAVRLLGGTPLDEAFAQDAGKRPQLLAVGQESSRDFLESLDVYFYRKHPGFFETGGTGILEAMAMELPVVVFPDQCGIAEIIRDGENGFLVDSEAQALELIDRLAADPALRARVGGAARTAVVELMRRQNADILAYYLGAGPDAGANWRQRLRGWLRRGDARVSPCAD